MSKITTKIYESLKDIIVRNRYIVIIFLHLIQVALANYFAFIIRFESILLPSHVSQFLTYLPLLLTVRLILFIQAGLYKNLWRYSSINDLIKIISSTTVGSLIFFIVIRYLLRDTSYPISIYVLDWLLLITISGGERLFIRVFREYLRSETSGKRILIVGACNAGVSIVREMKNDPKSPYRPIGFIDEDPYKKGLVIHGVPIFGPISMIPYIIESKKTDEILIATSSTNSEDIKKIYDLCKPYNIQIKKLPLINDILNGNVTVAKKLGQRLIDAGLVTEEQIHQALKLQKEEGGRLGSKLLKLQFITEEKLSQFISNQFDISHIKPISLEDLLQREPVKPFIESVRGLIDNKSVLVTGAGGSIGSELCRQIAKYNPSSLILLDRYENGLYKIDLELNGWMNGDSKKNIFPVVGDILDKSSMENLFLKYKPQIVFHAAAYKHVPLMEHNPIEAVKNNVFGTKNILDVASRHNIEQFVMISTDKAVNPTSIMGATKRIAEFLTITMNNSSSKKFTIVRFGNVLGSNGSVVPIFKEQIRKGGPITITHPDMKRFLMLIPEAVQLVLVAASSGNGGEIFVLDMGEQIKIIDLAENLIRFSGFIPHKEIKIEFTGLRPGEKLYEELFDRTEKSIPTFHKKLKIAIPEVPSRNDLNKYLKELQRVVHNNSIDEAILLIKKIIPGFRQENILEDRGHLQLS